MRFILFLFFLFPFHLLAQPSQQWYDANDRGNQYEGTYTRKVSNPSISLVSLSTQLPAYSFGKKNTLQVSFFTPGFENYNLHAEELRVSQFYWMEDKKQKSQKGWNVFSGWQVDYFLRRLSIDYRNLGVLVYLGDKTNRHFVPAYVGMDGETTEPRLYIAQIRLGRPSSGGSFRLYKGQTKISTNLLKKQTISKKSSGTVFPIVTPIEILDKKEGWYTVEINLKEAKTGDPFTYSFSFYHFPKS